MILPIESYLVFLASTSSTSFISLLINSVVTHIEQIYYISNMLAQTDPSSLPFGLDLSIGSLRTRKFSIGIFIFLIISLIIFSIIIVAYLPKGEKKLKKGEKIMFGALIMGMVLAVLMGWLQLIDGYLL